MTLSADQLQARRRGIGGSDAGAILGVDPWREPVHVYQRLISDPSNDDRQDDDADKPWLRWGQLLESAICDEYARRTGARLRRVPGTLTHDRYPFMIAHPDRRVLGARKIVEAKTAWDPGREWGEPGSSEVPYTYIAQCTHYAAVMGLEVVDLAVLFLRGRQMEIYTIPADQMLVRGIEQAERSFWHDHVLKHEPPTPQSIESCRLLWARDTGEAIVADPDSTAAAYALADLKGQIKSLQAQHDELELTLRTAMREASYLVSPAGEELATWKAHTRRSLDTKRLRAEHPAIADAYMSEADVRPFRLKITTQIKETTP